MFQTVSIGRSGDNPGFRQLAIETDEAVEAILEAVYRGDRAVVVTGPVRAERDAVLARVAARARDRTFAVRTLAAPHAPLDDAIEAIDWPEDRCASPYAGPPLLLVNEAQAQPASRLQRLGDLSQDKVQVVLFGGPLLLARLTDHACGGLLHAVRLAVTLMHPDAPNQREPGLAALRAAIARTEAKLAAQKRMLAIFAEDRGPHETAPPFGNG